VGLENRDYYRGGGGGCGSWGFDGVGQVVKYLIVANIIVFLLQIFVTRPLRPEELQEYLGVGGQRAVEPTGESNDEPTDEQSEEHVNGPSAEEMEMFLPYSRVSVVQEWFELDPHKVVYQAQIWRLLTYAFCHDRLGIWHILFNMLFLYWFGKTLESMYGSEEFLLFYLTSAVAASLCHIALALFLHDSTQAIGASGAVMGVMMLYAIHFPRRQIYIFLLIPIEIRWVVALWVIFDVHPVLLALAGTPDMTGVAHAAHLGGLAFGYVYWRYSLRLQTYWSRLRQLRMPRCLGPRRHIQLYKPPRETPRDDLDDLVDKILQKIHEQGDDSLTDVEREVLKRASEKYARRGKSSGAIE
jgi:membrane associated rhomboid family serine protease